MKDEDKSDDEEDSDPRPSKPQVIILGIFYCFNIVTQINNFLQDMIINNKHESSSESDDENTVHFEPTSWPPKEVGYQIS